MDAPIGRYLARYLWLGTLLWMVPQHLALAQIAEPDTAPVAVDPRSEADSPELSLLDAVILGVVEGITEYLPISSTGHLIITNTLLGLDAPTPIVDQQGNVLWRIPPGPLTEGVPYTFSDAANAYTIVIQGGAIAAVLVLYWQRIASVVFGLFGRNPHGLRLGVNLLVAFLPAAALGLLLKDWIEARLFGVAPVAAALVAGGILMLFVERWRKKRDLHSVVDNAGRDIQSMRLLDALTIGFLQCIAMWPGTSRSMMTIVGGYLVGLRPAQAAEFSFLLGLITLSAASAYKAVSDREILLAALDPLAMALGTVVSFIAAMLAIRWLIAFISKHGLAPFAWYRIVLAVILVWVVL